MAFISFYVNMHKNVKMLSMRSVVWYDCYLTEDKQFLKYVIINILAGGNTWPILI